MVHFRALAAAGGLRSLAAAMDLYTGDPLPGWDEERVLPERVQPHRLCVGLLAHPADRHETACAYDAAVDVAERLQAGAPFNEAHVRRLMRLRALQGDAVGVARLYQQTVVLLRDEVGACPSPETVDLYERLRSRRRARNVTAVTRPGGGRGESDHPVPGSRADLVVQPGVSDLRAAAAHSPRIQGAESARAPARRRALPWSTSRWAASVTPR